MFFTPARTLPISGLKYQVVKLPWLKIDGEKWPRIFYFEIYQASSEIPANPTGQFSLSGQICFHWATTTLKGLGEFQNKKILDHFSPSFLSQKCQFQDSRFYSANWKNSSWCALPQNLDKKQNQFLPFSNNFLLSADF